MINFPYVSLPEHYTRLLVANIQNSTQSNNNLEAYLYENKELNVLVRKIFRDIDPDGFLGKIISISGWPGIRNRLAAVYIEYAMTGKFPESANLALVTDIINIENKKRKHNKEDVTLNDEDIQKDKKIKISQTQNKNEDEKENVFVNFIEKTQEINPENKNQEININLKGFEDLYNRSRLERDLLF